MHLKVKLSHSREGEGPQVGMMPFVKLLWTFVTNCRHKSLCFRHDLPVLAGVIRDVTAC